MKKGFVIAALGLSALAAFGFSQQQNLRFLWNGAEVSQRARMMDGEAWIPVNDLAKVYGGKVSMDAKTVRLQGEGGGGAPRPGELAGPGTWFEFEGWSFYIDPEAQRGDEGELVITGRAKNATKATRYLGIQGLTQTFQVMETNATIKNGEQYPFLEGSGYSIAREPGEEATFKVHFPGNILDGTDLANCKLVLTLDIGEYSFETSKKVLRIVWPKKQG